MNLKDLKVAYIGTISEEMQIIKDIFKQVDVNEFPVKGQYDLIVWDFKYLSREEVRQIERSIDKPLIIIYEEDSPRMQLKFLHNDAYLCVRKQMCKTKMLEGMAQLYLEHYEKNKERYRSHLFNNIMQYDLKVRAGEPISLVSLIDSKEDEKMHDVIQQEVAIETPRDVWNRWKDLKEMNRV